MVCKKNFSIVTVCNKWTVVEVFKKMFFFSSYTTNTKPENYLVTWYIPRSEALFYLPSYRTDTR